jgi:hypothetical protein
MQCIALDSFWIAVNFVDYSILVRSFNALQLPFGAQVEHLSAEDTHNVLTNIYQSISSYHFSESTVEETVEALLKFLDDILAR